MKVKVITDRKRFRRKTSNIAYVNVTDILQETKASLARRIGIHQSSIIRYERVIDETNKR